MYLWLHVVILFSVDSSTVWSAWSTEVFQHHYNNLDTCILCMKPLSITFFRLSSHGNWHGTHHTLCKPSNNIMRQAQSWHLQGKTAIKHVLPCRTLFLLWRIPHMKLILLNPMNVPSMLALWFYDEGLLNQMMSVRKMVQQNQNSSL